MSNYVQLREITSKIGAGATPTGGKNAYHSQGISFIRSQNVHDFKFSLDGLAFIDEKQAKELNNVTVEENDILLNITGDSIARVCVVPNKILPARVNQHVAIIRCISNVDCHYVFYYLENLKPYLLKICGVGGTRNALTKEAIEKLEIHLPEISTQQKIASVLSALDSKIELNNRINAELEAMAKTLYDYWFVQFDFPDKNGKPYKSNGGKMVWNEELKREIPEGWEVGTLLNIANYENGLPCQKFRPTGTEFLRVIKIREMNEGFSSNTEFVRTDIPEKAIIENGDVLFSWSASLDVKIWTGGKGALNQHIFKVTSNNYPKSFYFFQLINYLQHFKMMAENRKTTMGHITQEHLKQSRIAIPPKQLTLALDKIITPLFSKKVINEIENQKLTELRDWLLPMLMNGQVKVSEL
jgi:type I restriction enzyme S subunit